MRQRRTPAEIDKTAECPNVECPKSHPDANDTICADAPKHGSAATLALAERSSLPTSI